MVVTVVMMVIEAVGRSGVRLEEEFSLLKTWSSLMQKRQGTESARTELDVRLGLISDCPDRVRHQRLLPNTSDSGPSPTSKAKK
ncbi:hypothetical protein LXL04_035639 [Taraxacum kok-saghyz]